MENSEVENNVENEILIQFRQNLQDILNSQHTDQYLLKFLRVKQFDLRKAEKLFRYAYWSRKTYNLEEALKTYQKPEVCEKFEFLGFLGFAKDGSPVRYIAIGCGDYNGFVSSLSTISLALYCSHIIEQDLDALRKENKTTGRNITDITYIFDVEGLTVLDIAHKHVIETGLDLMRMYQDIHPEGVRRLLLTNAPGYFSVIFNIFKPILRFGLIDRIHVLSKEASPGELLKYIDADVLPASLGGNRVDSNGDPKCSEFIKYGGKVPEKYYLRNQNQLQPNDPGVETGIVPARSVIEYVVNVPEAGSTIKVEMRCDNSINLKILYRKFGSDISSSSSSDSTDAEEDNFVQCEGVISPPAKLQIHIAPIDSVLACPRAGQYVFRFDNTFSWLIAKNLVYRYEVIPPKS